MPNRILVTGASGFLGSAIVPRLHARGEDVLALDPAAPANAAVRYINDDLSDLSRLRALLSTEHVTHIIHAGGVSGPMVLPDRPDRVMAINVIGSLNLLHAALDANVKTFVYCSSVSAIGPFYEDRPIGADYPMRPATPYGYSKAAVDMVLHGLWGRVALDLCSLRFTGIYGPGRRTSFDVDSIVAAAMAGEPVRIPAATDAPYVYIDDAADAAVAACLSDRRTQLAYFVAYPEQVSLQDIATAATAAAGPFQLDIDATNPPIARGPLDIGPSARDFGFAPKIDHRDGIRRMVAARRSQAP